MGYDDPGRRGLVDGPADDSDQALARWLAWLAGERLLDLRQVRGFADPDALRRSGDQIAQSVLRSELTRLRPADAILSEEDAATHDPDADRRTADRVWIVDPLDGTREYGEQGRTDWAVHVALWERGRGLTAGAVAIPGRDLVLGTDAAPPPPSGAGPLRVAVSRSRPPGFVTTLLDRVGGVAVPSGSAGVKVCAVVTGDADAYLHAGGQYEWDSAAPVAVAAAAGLHCSRLDGSPLEYNRAHPRLPDLLVCRPEHRDQLLAVLTDLIKIGEVVVEEQP